MGQLDKLNALRDVIAPESAEERYMNSALVNANLTALLEGWPAGTEQWAELVLSSYASDLERV